MWEQFDVASGPRPINTDPGDGPLFRSVPPGPGLSRPFPNLADILSNTVRLGEFLPTTDRPMTFRLTARDDRTGGGGVAYDEAVLTVAGPPFFITSPNGGEVVGAGCELPVTWTVGGGSVANLVSLGISNDGGNSFDPLLALTANDGAASTVAPCGATTDARVEASGVGPGVGFVLTSVMSSEPDNGLGDGDTASDIQDAAPGTADVDVTLRAERSGLGDGRVYTLAYTATDASDNQAEASAVVVVPHGKKP